MTMLRFLLILVVVSVFSLPVKVNSETLSGWIYNESVDEFTDELSSVGAGVHKGGNLVALVACLLKEKENLLFLLISPESYFSLKDSDEVKIRIDKDNMEIYQAQVMSGRSQSVFIGYPHGLAKRMMRGNKMIIKVGNSDTIRVSLKGSAKPIQRVLDKCK